ncbi:MAG: hypothetical protein QW348_00760 [Ignisphaera sp.]
MFLGSGTIVEVAEARVKSLGRILKDYVAKNFSGYVIFRNDVRGVYIFIALVEGRLAACRSIEAGRVYEGAECSETAMKYLYEPEGVIEVQNAPHNLLILDATIFPLSKIERPTSLSSLLGAEVGVQRVVAAPPSPSITVPPPPAQPVTTPATQPMPKEVAVAKEVTPEKPVKELPPQPQPVPPPPPPALPKIEKPTEAEITVSSECIDPLALYMVIKSGQLLEALTSPSPYRELLEKIRNIVKERKPSYIYISGELEGATLKILYDSQSSSISITIEREGASICGNEARKELEGKSISNVKIWHVA